MNEELNVCFPLYLAQDNSDWQDMSLREKEFAIHDYLSQECGVGVFTNIKDAYFIVLTYDDENQVSIFAFDDVETIDAKLDKFINTIDSITQKFSFFLSWFN